MAPRARERLGRHLLHDPHCGAATPGSSSPSPGAGESSPTQCPRAGPLGAHLPPSGKGTPVRPRPEKDGSG